MGLPCSGKSSSINTIIENDINIQDVSLDNFVKIDYDEARYFCQDYIDHVITGKHYYDTIQDTNIIVLPGFSDDFNFSLNFYGIIDGDNFIIKTDPYGTEHSLQLINIIISNYLLADIPKQNTKNILDYNIIIDSTCCYFLSCFERSRLLYPNQYNK